MNSEKQDLDLVSSLGLEVSALLSFAAGLLPPSLEAPSVVGEVFAAETKVLKVLQMNLLKDREQLQLTPSGSMTVSHLCSMNDVDAVAVCGRRLSLKVKAPTLTRDLELCGEAETGWAFP